MPMWHDDIPIEKGYKDAIIIDRKTANALYETEEGHWLDQGRIWARPEYAYRAARRYVTPSYFVLVKLHIDRGRIAWGVIILTTSVANTFPSK